ncbi:MAG: DUF4421 family protein [Bdellovibrionales bacterium]
MVKFLAILLMGGGLTTPAWAAHNHFNSSPFALKLSADIPGYDIQFKSIDNPDKIVKFNPNLAQLLGVHLSFKGLVSVGYGFKLQQLERDKVMKGHTDYQDWRFAFTFDHFMLSANYQQYKGFYIGNSDDVDPSWTSAQAYLQAPNLKLTSGALSFTYIWSPEDFSLTAAMDHTVRQEKSGGSFLMGFAVGRTEFADDSPFIPTVIRNQFGVDQNIESGSFTALTARLGYGHTFVWDRSWFLAMAAQVGGGQQQRVYKDATQERHGWHVATKLDALLSLGYSGDDIFSGLMAVADTTSYRTTSIEISSGLWGISLFAGGRF